MDENHIIRKLFGEKAVPLDDCYFFPPGLLVTTDSLAEGTHFKLQWSTPTQIADKLVEVNVSDIIASGGRPEDCFLNLGLSKETQTVSWLEEFTESFRRSLEKHQIYLRGGDTFFSQTTVLSLTVLGRAERVWDRTQAIVGDSIYLTGPVGASSLGLEALRHNWKEEEWQPAIQKHLSPKSRRDLAQALSNKEIHACMDITDGLVQDLEKLAQASKVNLKIEIEAVPMDPLARRVLGLDACLSSGEELELVFTTNVQNEQFFFDLGIKKIGKVCSGEPKVEYYRDGRLYFPQNRGYIHFLEA